MTLNDKPPISDYLAHYASPYYDPAKAHEYYMRTRKLKGKRSTSRLSDEGKKVWSYTKEQIKAEKKEKVEAEQEKRRQETERLREQARLSRERIRSKLKSLNASMSKRRKRQGGNSNQAAAERERISAELKAAIGAARQAYETAKTELDTTYEEIYQREFDKIAAEMPKVSKRRTKRTRS